MTRRSKPSGAFGVAVHAARTRAGLTQARAAELLDVAPVTVSRWETGAIVPNKTARAGVISILRAAGD